MIKITSETMENLNDQYYIDTQITFDFAMNDEYNKPGISRREVIFVNISTSLLLYYYFLLTRFC
jgi:hypothetical protein